MSISTTYKNAVGRIARLDDAGEYALGERIVAGNQAAQALEAAEKAAEKAGTPVAAADRAAWAAAIADGREARNRLVEANLRLPISMAGKFGTSATLAVSAEELVSAGNYGLILAAGTFDPSRGRTFASWAWQSINRELMAAADKGKHTIAIPEDRERALYRVRRAWASLRAEHGHNPSMAQVAAALNITVEELYELETTPRVVVSLGAEVDHHNGSTTETMTLGESIPAPTNPQTDDTAHVSAVREELYALLDRLDDRERQVLTLRFGLDGGNARSLTEVGTLLALTAERVRMVEVRALAQLKHPTMYGATKAARDVLTD